MFISRATRHDRADIEELMKNNDWDGDVSEGVTYFARDGAVIGCVRVIEVSPQTVVVDDVLVDRERRGQGIGAQLMQAAMNSRGGTLYLCCHEEGLDFYGKLGFEAQDKDSLPEAVKNYFARDGDLDPPPGHRHFFMRAR